ncbi:MAG: adhesin [Providencia sp.]|jgi:hypothetical protein|nr:adhesin [Providencia sp.]
MSSIYGYIKKYIFLNFSIIFSAFFSSYSSADYAPRVVNPNDGYIITLQSDSLIATNPIKGSDGKNYYQIGQPISIASNSPSVTVRGKVYCTGRKWGIDKPIPPNNAFHRLFMYVPKTGISIEGKETYRINKNLVMSAESNIDSWVNIYANACADQATGSNNLGDVDYFRFQFPIVLSFYINEKIIDGQLMIPSIDLGGYVRAFVFNTWEKPPYDSWPINESSAPMRLGASQLNVNAKCETLTSSGTQGSLNLSHGQLNSLNYDSLVTGKVTYTCSFTTSQPVRLFLDYVTDDDMQKRLPMINSTDNNRIYSNLVMIDESTGKKGKEIKTTIKDLKDITIESYIQGHNAVSGEYHGTAWLIATYD